MLVWFWADSGRGFKASEIVELDDNLLEQLIKVELELWVTSKTILPYDLERITYGYKIIEQPNLILSVIDSVHIVRYEYKCDTDDSIEIPRFLASNGVLAKEIALEKWKRAKARELKQTI